MQSQPFDIAVLGAGAAGLFAAIHAARTRRVALLDGRDRPGAKILISGGGRCNVTNETVTGADFVSSSPPVVRGLLAQYPPERVRGFFAALGVPLYAEPMGKLFPRSDSARDVLAALLRAAETAGIERRFGWKVDDVRRAGDEWVLTANGKELRAQRLVVATGGLSYPKTGSDGFGYGLARRFGHAVLPTVPALVPLRCETPAALAGLTVPVTLRIPKVAACAGSMLFTHTGVTGPAALDISIHVARGAGPVLADFWTPVFEETGDKLPGACRPRAPRPTSAEEFDRELLAHPARTVASVLADRLPRRLVDWLVADRAERRIGSLSRAERRAIDLLTVDLHATGTLGYDKAEVTAGGVDLRELDRVTLESRLQPGLHFCGEVVDVTGRLGGFNFQWAWASGYAVGQALAGG